MKCDGTRDGNRKVQVNYTWTICGIDRVVYVGMTVLPGVGGLTPEDSGRETCSRSSENDQREGE